MINKVRVDELWQVAMWIDRGYRIKFNGWQMYMVRDLSIRQRFKFWVRRLF